MRYNAGFEVYTQGLAQALAERHDVHVYTRQENAFPEFRETTHSAIGFMTHSSRFESDDRQVESADPRADPRITLHVVNMARALDGYRHAAVEAVRNVGLSTIIQPAYSPELNPVEPPSAAS